MSKTAISFIIVFLISQSLLAHGSHGSGIVAGFTHPIFGFDHLLAIGCLGLIIPTMKDKKSWLVAVAFTLTMAISGWLGIGTEGFLYMENGIALSVVLLGILLVLKVKLPLLLFTFAAIVIAFFHGFAHGVEMPASTSALVYISGYSLGVILIFVASIGISNLMLKSTQPIGKHLVRTSGILIAGLGFCILFS